MTATPIDDIEAWSKKLSPWRQDCLRRLAISGDLTDKDIDELLAMIKEAAGVRQTAKPPKPVPFTKAHFTGGAHQPVVLKGIANVKNVNRLLPNASLDFSPTSLTAIYGRNGSGKSGFVRILRTACRTRIENPAKLKVLANVYGGSTTPQSAEIVVDLGSGDTPIQWTPGAAADPRLAQVAVFDTASAQLYVDGGNQIRYLPFGLALPHRMNAVCLTLKERLDAERETAVGNKASLASISFPVTRNTAAQSFDRGLNKATTDAAIAAATQFEAVNQTRLDEITGILSAGAAAAADLAALSTWLNAVTKECESAIAAFSDDCLTNYTSLRSTAISTRQAATVAADELFTKEPLPGIGSDAWRTLWAAAREYSVSEAYVGQPFPVIVTENGPGACVLCQQPLLADGAARMQRFQAFMNDTLDVAASVAEKALSDAIEGLPKLSLLGADDFAGHMEQIRRRNSSAADALASFQAAAITRRIEAVERLNGEDGKPVPLLTSPLTVLSALAEKLKAETDALNKASDTQERDKLVIEKAELEDRKLLANNRPQLTTRRDLLVTDAAYASALAEVQTRGVTQKANELVDVHLTKAVVKRFDAERARFGIAHLKIALSRKSGQTKAEFEVDPQTKLTRATSEILSEGEQRALALAGFLTEVALTDGSGPIVVDDPVSSLDRDRSSKVAERLAEEACHRQVIVFTHDIIFFNELCRAADSNGIEPTTVALFSDKDAAGKIDGAGMVWKGLTVAKRIGRIKNDFAPLAKLHSISPADYEYQIKNLYGRLRDIYERAVEEVILCEVVQRGSDVIQTQKLRSVTLSHALAIRFHEGMTRANTHSHDNPASDTVPVPTPAEFLADISSLEQLVADLKADSAVAEAARPQMKLKK